MSKRSRHGPLAPVSGRHLIVVAFAGLLVKAIRPVPVVLCETARAINSGVKPAKVPSTVREGSQRQVCHQIECATANRPVAAPGVEDDVAVQQSRRRNQGLKIKDLRADRNRPQV
jgi:hypothetical protein